MNRTTQEILTSLDPHWDRIVRCPMSDAEVDDLGKLVELPVPVEFRDYLKCIGLFQDLTNWDVSPIMLFEKPPEFTSAREFIATLDPPQTSLFPFGGDGAGNLFCLPPDGCKPSAIRFIDHETGNIKREMEFSDWLASVVKKVLKSIQTRPLNERKEWCVQFSFSKTGFPELLELLSTAFEVEMIDSDWMNQDISPAKVTSSDRRIRLSGTTIKLGQLEYVGWEAPLLSFDMQEPVLKDIELSEIRLLDALFMKNCPDYKLVDYGTLGCDELEKH